MPEIEKDLVFEHFKHSNYQQKYLSDTPCSKTITNDRTLFGTDLSKGTFIFPTHYYKACHPKSPVIWQKGESENGGNKNTKHAKFSKKRMIFTHTCAYQGVKIIHFSENLACFVFLLPPF